MREPNPVSTSSVASLAAPSSAPRPDGPRAPSERPTRVALFVTCLVDLFRPNVGFAAVKLLEDAGCVVEVPEGQTCCGQPAYNSGDRADAKTLARAVIATFEPYPAVVVPSGSCAGMIKHHYPELFTDEPDWRARAETLAARTHELVSFLVDELGVAVTDSAFSGRVTYHDSCSGLRELGVKDQPRRLLAALAGVTVAEMAEPEVCCGFGGTFCVKYPEISDAMVTAKAKDIDSAEADLVLAGDMGCLLNIAGKLKRLGSPTGARHVAEVLAGLTDVPAIGDTKR